MLPTLNHSTYTLKIPSTGKEIKYRPFLVKEEKTLMMAAESKDTKAITNATCDIIQACVLNENINPKELTSFDVEYIFLKIRGKSVGETIDFNIKCEECSKTTPVSLNLDDIVLEIDGKDLNKKVMITDSIGVELKAISFGDAIKLSQAKVEDRFETTIKSCLASIFDNENVYDIKDVNDKELSEWISNLSQRDLKEIEKFVLQLPKLSHTINYKCIHCGHEGSIELEGLEDFFA